MPYLELPSTFNTDNFVASTAYPIGSCPET
jgi:hypothetical protein